MRAPRDYPCFPDFVNHNILCFRVYRGSFPELLWRFASGGRTTFQSLSGVAEEASVRQTGSDYSISNLPQHPHLSHDPKKFDSRDRVSRRSTRG